MKQASKEEIDNWYEEINLLQEKHNRDGVGKRNYHFPLNDTHEDFPIHDITLQEIKNGK